MNIDLCVSFADEDGRETGRWEASYSPSKNRCTKEKIYFSPFLLEVSKGEIRIRPLPDSQNGKDWKSPVTFDYEGSILSALKEDLLPPPILECNKLMKEIRSLDLLSPEYLRQRTRESAGSLGLGGQKLSAYLHEMRKTKCRELKERLRRVYPQLENLDIKPLRSGWKQLEITCIEARFLT